MRYEHAATLDLKRFNNFVIKDSDDDATYTDIPNYIVQRADTDGAWKHALEILFFEFLQLFIPDIYDLIDQSTEPESKETE